MTTDSDSTDDPTVLSEAQQVRVAALHAARSVLVTTKGGDGFSARVEGDVDVTDLHSLAHYITTGEDPWPSRRPV